jgi:hypothetical protein
MQMQYVDAAGRGLQFKMQATAHAHWQADTNKKGSRAMCHTSPLRTGRLLLKKRQRTLNVFSADHCKYQVLNTKKLIKNILNIYTLFLVFSTLRVLSRPLSKTVKAKTRTESRFRLPEIYTYKAM